MTKAPTIHDIARAAQVSPSTVSRVLTGNAPVTASKRAAVLAAIDSLQFKPNLVARGLARGKSMTIGVLTQSMASLYFGELAQGIDTVLVGSPYHPLYGTGLWQIQEEFGALSMLLERQVDGLIILSGGLPEATLHTIAAEMPLILVSRRISGLEEQCIHAENYEGAYRAMQHLIELGHRRIAHITGILSIQDAVDRQTGYCQALHDAGLEIDERLIIEGRFHEASGVAATEALLARALPFTAIFAANDQMAYGARLVLYRHGLQVPEDIALVGFDDLPSSAYMTPPLTTVRQHMFEVGRAAAEAMLRQLDNQAPLLPKFPTELVIRESTAPPR